MAQGIVTTETGVTGVSVAVMVLALLGVCEGSAGIMLIIYTLITGNSLKDYKRLWNFKASRLVLLCGLFGGAIATTCLVGAVPLCGATITYAIFALMPIAAAIGGRIFLKEKFALRMVLGIVIAVAGVLVAIWAPPEALPNFISELQLLLSARSLLPSKQCSLLMRQIARIPFSAAAFTDAWAAHSLKSCSLL